MKKLLGPSFVLVSAALLAGCAGEDEQPGQQSASGFTEAPQTITTKTTALPIQSDFNGMRSAVDAERDIAFVGSAHGTKVSALRLATRQHLWQLTLDGDVEQVFFAAGAERLYVSTATTLYALEPMTGAVLHSAAISSPVVTITYLPARNSAAEDQLIIGQRANSSDWLLSALNPDTLEAVASTTLPIVDEQPKLQITAGAGLIWSMYYDVQRLFTIRPYLLMGDAIYPIDDHQVVYSLRDTGLMISPDGEWLITGGNNVLSSALDSDVQEYFEANVNGFDHFVTSVAGGGVFWGDTFGLMVRDDLTPNADTGVREWYSLGRFKVSQVLSTVSGVYALGHDHELGQALQWVTGNRTDLPSIANPYTLSADQAFVPFDGEESHQQAELYLTVKLSAGDGSAIVQPVCYEPCTYANALEVPLLEEAQQAHINIHQLTDGPIAGVIVTASGDVQIGEAEWSFNIPTACPSGTQFTGDIDNSIELYGEDGYNECEVETNSDGVAVLCPPIVTPYPAPDLLTGGAGGAVDQLGCQNSIFSITGTYCAESAGDCEMNLTLAGLSCDGGVMLIGGSVDSGGTGTNDLTGSTDVHTDYLDNLDSQPSKTTCF